MKQSLQLRLGQRLIDDPKLQRACRLLQLPSSDLQAEVRTILDFNLMPERTDERRSWPDVAGDPGGAGRDGCTRRNQSQHSHCAGTLPKELPMCSPWDDICEPYDSATAYACGKDEVWALYERYAGAGESLRKRLYWQMWLIPFNDRDVAIATAIVNAIDESVDLTLSLEEIF